MNDAEYKEAEAKYQELKQEFHSLADKMKGEFQALEEVLAKYRGRGSYQRACDFCGESMDCLETGDSAAGWICDNESCGT